jgi:phospholipase D
MDLTPKTLVPLKRLHDQTPSLRPRTQPKPFAKWLRAVLELRPFSVQDFLREADLTQQQLDDIISGDGGTKGTRRDAYVAAVCLLDGSQWVPCKSHQIPVRNQMSVYFTGMAGEHVGRCQSLLADAILAAEQEVLVMAYWMTSTILMDAIAKVARRGVWVKVIYDPKGWRMPSRMSEDLTLIPDTVHDKAHNKIIIIDETTVFTGSFNFTNSADHRNAENLIEISDPPIVRQFAKYWRDTCHRLYRPEQRTRDRCIRDCPPTRKKLVDRRGTR